MNTASEKLEQFLAARPQFNGVTHEQLTADASTREYFRIDSTPPVIACVYPTPGDPQAANYLDVTRLFVSAGLPVAKILEVDGEMGVIVHEDFGNIILRIVLDTVSPVEREAWLDRAIGLIAKIQAGTKLAYEQNSIAARLSFDVEKLLWELRFFKTHYFETLRKEPLTVVDDEALEKEFLELSEALAARATVLTHRDFHAANIMVDNEDGLHIIDHQDARIGSASYDLVSLLLDRVTEPPGAEWLAEKRELFLAARRGLGLKELDAEDFANEFRLQTIQRCLKAVGTFSFQSVNRGKTYFLPFIEPMFRIVLRAAANLGRFPNIQRVLNEQIK